VDWTGRGEFALRKTTLNCDLLALTIFSGVSLESDPHSLAVDPHSSNH
jgi:hypothetical protein